MKMNHIKIAIAVCQPSKSIVTEQINKMFKFFEMTKF